MLAICSSCRLKAYLTCACWVFEPVGPLDSAADKAVSAMQEGHGLLQRAFEA